MFRAYLGNPARYATAFIGGWYVSGDLVTRDADGYYWFVGRADDVIESAGHLIGPFEVEAALMAHPAVAEAGAYGVPDAVAGNVVHAVIVLRPDVASDEVAVATITSEIQAAVKERKGSVQVPKQVHVVDSVPVTALGKPDKKAVRAQFWEGAGRSVG